ncbi:MAG: hypothetical protein Q8M03_10455 [Legionella sp.]|nr:hypothetical protein [Legionella sp.]
MLPTDKLNSAGEHAFFFEGAIGKIEAVLTAPAVSINNYVALLGHPHSLQGGSMTNKVVTTMARAFRELGIPSLRFNFRGVGASEGAYDAGIGESEDMIMLARLWQQDYPEARFLFAGFSFGSYVAYRTAALIPHDLLITVAPAVHHYNYQEFSPRPNPWYILQGDEDEVVPLQLVLDFAAQSQPALPVIRFPETGHFFHGKLLLLKPEIMAIVSQVIR